MSSGAPTQAGEHMDSSIYRSGKQTPGSIAARAWRRVVGTVGDGGPIVMHGWRCEVTQGVVRAEHTSTRTHGRRSGRSAIGKRSRRRWSSPWHSSYGLRGGSARVSSIASRISMRAVAANISMFAARAADPVSTVLMRSRGPLTAQQVCPAASP